MLLCFPVLNNDNYFSDILYLALLSQRPEQLSEDVVKRRPACTAKVLPSKTLLYIVACGIFSVTVKLWLQALCFTSEVKDFLLCVSSLVYYISTYAIIQYFHSISNGEHKAAPLFAAVKHLLCEWFDGKLSSQWDLSPEHRVRCLSDTSKYSNKDELFTDRSAGLIDGLLRFDIYIVDNYTSNSLFFFHTFLHSSSFIRNDFSTISALILR